MQMKDNFDIEKIKKEQVKKIKDSIVKVLINKNENIDNKTNVEENTINEQN